MTLLKRDLQDTQRSAYCSSTYSNLRTQFKACLLFCLYFRLTPIPAQLETICLYAQFLRCTLTPQSVRNYLSGIKLLHLFMGGDYPFTKDFIHSLTLRGVARKALHTPRWAPPVTPAILLQISAVLLSDTDPLSSTLFCAFLFTFFLMSRLANIVPASLKSFDPHRNLTRGEIAVTGSGLMVTFKCTKTIQFGEHLRIPLLQISGSPLCPVAAYQRMIHLVRAHHYSPVFITPRPAGLVPFTKHSFVSHFRTCLSSAGRVKTQTADRRPQTAEHFLR